MTRAVIDTSVLVSALIGSPSGGPALVVEAVRNRRLTFVASPGLLDELAVVLARPKFGVSSRFRGSVNADSSTATRCG